jgi:hypothetical protein
MSQLMSPSSEALPTASRRSAAARVRTLVILAMQALSPWFVVNHPGQVV